MSGKSKIEWTEQTWNPVVGCSIVSPGCSNCYAMKMAARTEAMGISRYDGTTRVVNGNAVWTGKISKAPSHTWLQPIERKKPSVYFVNSMSDLFHPDVPDDWILDTFTVMAIAHWHKFQVLTKRADRMRDFLNRRDLLDQIYLNWYGWSGGAREVQGWPLPNVWLGVSAERQQEADERIPLLLDTPAAIRFISAEPLLGPLDLSDYLVETARSNWDSYLDWVIVGGESGPGARPMHPDWARSLRDQCAAAGVPFFFKQWGGWKNGSDFAPDSMAVLNDGRVIKPTQDGMLAADRDDPVMRHNPTLMRRVGKHAAGRELDGVTHDALPAY